MYFIKIGFLVVVFYVSIGNVFSQDRFEGFGESDFSVNHNVSRNYNINASFRSRYFLYRNSNFKYEQRQLDIVHFSTFKIKYNKTLSIGLQYRNRDLFSNNSNEFRLTQQYNFNKKLEDLRFGHRLRFEQRFLSTQTVFRVRYRFAIDFPLNGQKLNIGETYFIGSLEALCSLSEKTSTEIDQRTTAQIGWQINETLKLQAGLEYRIEAFNIETESKLFLLTSAILKI